MAQQVKVLVAKSDDLNSIPSIHVVERDTQFPRVVWLIWYVHTHTIHHTQINVIKNTEHAKTEA